MSENILFTILVSSMICSLHLPFLDLKEAYLLANNPTVVTDYVYLNFNDNFNGVMFLFYLMIGNNV